MQALGEFVEQFAEIAVLGDRFGDLEQRLMLRLWGSPGQLASGNIAHSSENSIQVLKSSTGWIK
jgi:hypothetical protein